MDGNSPWGGFAAAPGGGQSPIPMNPGPPPPSAWPMPPGRTGQRRGFLLPLGVGVAILLAAAALVVALVKGGSEASSSPGPTQDAEPERAQVLLNDADRELCLAIGPLMRETQETRNTFQAVGLQNSPERLAAIPRFVESMNDWAQRIQKVLNDHAEPPRYLTRVLQRYIDDTEIYVVTLAPDRDSSKYETPIYDLTIMDFSGLIGRCGDLDAGWWY